MPSLSVVQTVPSMRRKDAPADSSPPNATEPSSRPGHEPLESDRHLEQRAGRATSATRSMIIDETERLADRGIRAPVRPVRVEVVDRDREVVVRVHQARRRA